MTLMDIHYKCWISHIIAFSLNPNENDPQCISKLPFWQLNTRGHVYITLKEYFHSAIQKLNTHVRYATESLVWMIWSSVHYGYRNESWISLSSNIEEWTKKGK